tara:strand:+ start:304 stop:633 length:330 start_codon:yes stop_codon:yes gene_type:complete
MNNMTQNLMSIVRGEDGKLVKSYSDSNKFVSDRDIDYPGAGIFHEWVRDKSMKEIPLYLAVDRDIETERTSDFDHVPTHFENILREGILNTSGGTSTDYSLLMPTGISN